MDDQPSFADLVARVQAGDLRAAAELFELYGDTIRRTIRIHMRDPSIRRVVNHSDVYQSVFVEFLQGAALGQCASLETPQHLLNRFLLMARTKVAECYRRHHAARRDLRRLEPGDGRELEVPARDPSPSQSLKAKDLLEKLRGGLQPDEFELFDLHSQGCSWDEIAERFGESKEALRKRLVRALGRVARELGWEADEDR
jgi:RNA polymerase sigma factor (sigma-70 family)